MSKRVKIIKGRRKNKSRSDTQVSIISIRLLKYAYSPYLYFFMSQYISIKKRRRKRTEIYERCNDIQIYMGYELKRIRNCVLNENNPKIHKRIWNQQQLNIKHHNCIFFIYALSYQRPINPIQLPNSEKKKNTIMHHKDMVFMEQIWKKPGFHKYCAQKSV